MLDQPVETEAVFTSPDPREADEVRRVLAEHGLAPEMRFGADPVTGVGGWVYGGGMATFYNIEVPVAHAERARKLLAHLAGPSLIPARAEDPVEESPPRVRTLPRTGLWIMGAVYAGSLAAFVSHAKSATDVLLFLAMYAGLALVILLAVRSAHRRR